MNRRKFLKCLPAAPAVLALPEAEEDEFVLRHRTNHKSYEGYVNQPVIEDGLPFVETADLPEGKWKPVETKFKKVKEQKK